MRNTRTAAGFGHMPSKTHAEKMLHVTFGIHKTTIFCPLEQAEPLAEIPWRRSCETLEQQQDSGKNNNLLSSRASTTISRNPLEAQLRNTRTAAGFGHMPSKTHAEKVLHVTFGIHKTTIFCPLEQAEPLNNNLLSSRASRTISRNPLEAHVAKHSNSSRIRAHAKQNARRKSASRHLWNP